MNEMQTHLPIFDVSQRLCNGVGEIFSVAWEGEGKDKLVVIGDGVDAATLTTKLDKKLCCVELLAVEEVKEKKEEKKEVKKKPEEVKKPEEEKKKPKEEKKKPEEVTEPTPQYYQPYPSYPSYPFEYRLCGPVVYGYEDPCTSTCNIM